MAAGYLGGDCVQAQIDATIDSAIDFARSQIGKGESLEFCADCDEEIPEARRKIITGCRYCVLCQSKHDQKVSSGYNRRGSKDSQIR
ncbi:DksA-like zinc-finger protein [Cronobacter phage A24]|uniref:C4-type zinc finger protein n=1 Tax=Cronobacter phage A24 TaxID=2795745 RepID=A0A7T5UEK5_9CAUD|nr:DksA-like zinc-finger protein [Cronobacter phage A24]QQG33726.1 C4-type zinc finger protein [Cronobacter phage A24]